MEIKSTNWPCQTFESLLHEVIHDTQCFIRKVSSDVNSF